MSHRYVVVRILAIWLLSQLVAGPGLAADWPMWRYDGNRSAASPEVLPGTMHLQWELALPEPRQAWPEEPRIEFDASYEPVVAGKTMFVGSMVQDSVTAYDTDTGGERWRFYADGPVRFAPAVWENRVYFASDDGCLYCVDAADGLLLWRFQGCPSNRKVLGNGRLISSWPARGGPVVADGKVYFAAGIWPTLGVFVYALDARTGEVVWVNEGTGATYMAQAYGRRAAAFSGPSPQGYLVAVGDKLLVPCGRSWPACFDRATGEFVYYHLGHSGGNSHVAGIGDYFVNGGWLHDLGTGNLGYALGPANVQAWDLWPVVLTADTAYSAHEGLLRHDIRNAEIPTTVIDKERDYVGWLAANGRAVLRERKLDALAWPATVEADSVWLIAGRRLYASKGGRVMAVELDDGRVSWEAEVAGEIGSVIAGDGKLFVVTLGGGIRCFGGSGSGGVTREEATPATSPTDEWTRKARAILDATEAREGYCLAVGLETGRLVEELVRQSELEVIGIDSDPATVDAVRRRLDAAGLYGTRAAVHVGDPDAFELPPYLASLVVSEEREAPIETIFSSLRPYGGVACLALQGEARGAVARWAESAGTTVVVEEAGGYVLARRVGPLAGAGEWTHELGDAANTCSSGDALAMAPLGVLWFGGPSGDEVFFNRHTHPPRVQVAGGRMFVQGEDVLHAVDVYTGRLLWKTVTPGLGAHFAQYGFYPGARIVGSQYVSVPDSVYVTTGSTCLRLDAATATQLAEFSLAGDGPAYEGPVLGYMAVSGDLLLAGGSPLLGDADFFAEDFEAFPKEILANLAEFIRACEGFEPVGEAGDGADGEFAARNLNALLNEPALAAMLPTDFAPKARAAVLSGGAWLQTGKGVPGERLFCNYEVSVPRTAEYSFWVRKFWHHGSFRWRFDDGPSGVCDRSVPFADSIYMRPNICANWKELGPVSLAEGGHTLRIELTNAPGADGSAAFDCFLLTTGSEKPERKFRPAAEDGAATVWWEGEDAVEHNFPPTPGVSPESDPEDEERGRIADDLARSIAAHVAGAGEAGGDKLRQLNRELLEARYPMLTLHLPKRQIGRSPWSGASSKRLVAMDRFSGDVRWTREARHSFRHNAIAIGDGKVFCIDRLPERMVQATRRRGAGPEERPRLMALDARTGDVVWSAEDDAEGSRLAYSEEHDILLQALDQFSLLQGEEAAARLVAYRGASGDVLWSKPGGPPRTLIVLGDSAIVDSKRLDLLTGEYTDHRVYASTKGCGGAVASDHLITFRSSTAAYVDLLNPGGTINFGGVRAGCTENLIPADGVVAAPNLAHGCSCNYPIFTSLALTHMPDVEMWGLSKWPGEGAVGVNFGAPGSRRAGNGTLWLEVPNADYQSQRPVQLVPEDPECFRVHSSRVRGTGLKWVAASGCRGLTSATITLSPESKELRPYTVRLHFAEPDDTAPGERVFSVVLQGQSVLRDFDIVREAGERLRPLVKEFPGIAIADELTLEFAASVGEPVICGVEVRAEEG